MSDGGPWDDSSASQWAKLKYLEGEVKSLEACLKMATIWNNEDLVRLGQRATMLQSFNKERP